MVLNDDIADIEKADGKCLLTFVLDELSGLTLHPSIFSIIHFYYTIILLCFCFKGMKTIQTINSTIIFYSYPS